MVDERQIDEDYDRAEAQVNHYSDRLHSLATVKSECFTNARTAFSEFLTLKDEQDSIMKYTGIILLGASLILPEIGIGLAIAKSALKAEKLAERVEQLEKNAQLVEKGLAMIEKTRAKRELKEKKKGDQEISEQREKALGIFENSMKVVAEDNELLAKSDELLDFVRHLIIDYKYYYKGNIEDYRDKSLQDMVKNTLSETDIKLKEDEIEQITRSYLYALVSGYCQRFCPLVFSHTFGSTDGYYRIDGLTDNQQKWLIDQFGLYVPRGKYFFKTPIVDVKRTLLSWGGKPSEEVTQPVMRYRH